MGRVAGLVAVIVVLGATVAYGVTQDPLGVIGPSNGIQPTGRQLHPVGRLTQLGNLPTGGALSTNGRFLWALSTGRGRNDVRIVQVAGSSCRKHGKHGRAGESKKRSAARRCKRRAARQVGRVVQTIPFPASVEGSPCRRTAARPTSPG